MIVKLLTEHHVEFLSLTGGCRGSSESTLVKMSNCWKSHAAAHLIVDLSVWTEEVPSSNALPTCGATVYLYTPSAYGQPPHHECRPDGALGFSLWV